MPTVLITGAARGLGHEFARQYAGDGWRVIATVRNPKDGAGLASLGKTVEVHLADVADRASLGRLAKDLKGAPIDVLICNAGIYGPRGQAIGQTDYETWEAVLRTNLMGPMATVEALLENVAKSERKQIIMMSTQLASITLRPEGDIIYGTSKTALNRLSKILATELGSRGITVVAVTPGWVKTNMGGSAAPLTVETSITGLKKVIGGLTRKDNGKFIHYDGTENPW